MARREEGNSLMKGDIYRSDTLPSKRMITLVSLLIRSILKGNTFKSLGIQLGMIRLRNMNIANALKIGGREELKVELKRQERGD